MDTRSQLTRRLSSEFDDEQSAARIVSSLSDETVVKVEALADGDIANSAWLNYEPSTVPADEVDSLWVFSFGYRFASGSLAAASLGGAVPSMVDLVPGPTNEALAHLAAAFVAEHSVPIVAQWEVARVLDQLGVKNVISVEPDISADGTVTYLSTAGVAAKGLQLMGAHGKPPGHAGILCFSEHAERGVLTARAAGMTADAPDGVILPAAYDPESGQDWTRQRETWIPVDLLGRMILKGASSPVT